jgi:hypothetical protein
MKMRNLVLQQVCQSKQGADARSLMFLPLFVRIGVGGANCSLSKKSIFKFSDFLIEMKYV